MASEHEAAAREIIAECRKWTGRADDAKRIPDMLHDRLPDILAKHFPPPANAESQLRFTKKALADTERRCGELERENHEAHAMLTGKFEIGWCMTHPDNKPDTELGKAAMEKNLRIAALESQRSEWPMLIESGDTIPSGHKIVYVNRVGGWGIQRGPLADIDGVFYYDLGPLQPPEASE